MLINELIKFDKALKNASEINFWWREDDLYAIKYPTIKNFIKYYKNIFKIKMIVSLYKKYSIPANFAVIPKNYDKYGEPITKLCNNSNFKFIIHGLEHKSQTQTNSKNEFPDNCDINHNLKLIIDKHKMLKNIFNDNMLDVFCPPYNQMNENLEKKLIENGIIISKSNKKIYQTYYNIDYDFCNWKKFRLKPYKQILKEIRKLIETGHQIIGFNGHYQRLTIMDIIFFDILFKIIQRNKNAKWINPFINNYTPPQTINNFIKDKNSTSQKL